MDHREPVEDRPTLEAIWRFVRGKLPSALFREKWSEEPYANTEVPTYDASAGKFRPGTPSGSGAPTNAQYVTLATDATLSAERVLTEGTGIDIVDAGAGSTVTLSVDLSELGTGTLDQAYDFGGAGAGRTINTTDGAVLLTTTEADSEPNLSLIRAAADGERAILEIGLTGEANPRIQWEAGGQMKFGPGGATAVRAALEDGGATGTLRIGNVGSSGGGLKAANIYEDAANQRVTIADGLFVGSALGLTQDTAAISSNNLTQTQPWMKVTATGTINNIVPSGYSGSGGDILIVSPNAGGVTVTIADGAGNIECITGGNIVLSAVEQVAILFRNGSTYYAMASTAADLATHIADTTDVHDHGSLSGLADDDHTQYLLAAGTRAGSTGAAQDFGTTGIKADVIAESTAAAGVNADGVLLKDARVRLGTGGGAALLKASGTTLSVRTNDDSAYANIYGLAIVAANTISTPEIQEAVVGDGVFVEGVHFEDGYASLTEIVAPGIAPVGILRAYAVDDGGGVSGLGLANESQATILKLADIVDLTDGGATTLHSHTGGALTDHTHAATGSGADGGGATLTPGVLNLPAAASPAQTADGQVVWDSDGNFLTIGDGASRQTFYPVIDATSDPLPVGTAADGTEASVARKDHVHAAVMTAVTGGNWKVFYTNGSGVVVELALGAANTVLTSNGASSAPSWGAGSSTARVWGGELDDTAQGADKLIIPSFEFQNEASVNFDKLVIVFQTASTTGVTHKFTFFKNGSKLDVVTISAVSRRGEAIITNFPLTQSDIISVSHSTVADPCTSHVNEGGKIWAYLIEADNSS